MIIVSADNPATQWVRYNGHLGKPLGKPAFTHATEVWGAPFGIGRRAVVNTIAAAASKMKEFGSGAATLALGARHYIQKPKFSDWKHIHVYAAQDVVRHPVFCSHSQEHLNTSNSTIANYGLSAWSCLDLHYQCTVLTKKGSWMHD